MSDDDDAGESLWGRTEMKRFSYTVAVPGTDTQTDPVVLTAVQDREVCAGTPAFPSHGHCVWDAALLLADYLQAKASDTTQSNGRSDDHARFHFQDKKVVELGAGVGLVGMALAVLGARVVLTDQNYALPLLNKNVAANFLNREESEPSAPSVATVVPVVEACQWGEPFESCGHLQRWAKSTDVVVFSDVLYHESAFLLLIKTLHELVSPSTDVFFSFETRSTTIEANFLCKLEETFDVELISREANARVFASFDYPEELFLYHARLKDATAEHE
ncbi:hypothetical protein BBJ28_00009394 [Nothophytophthora sp. Chile5]|nr:hypothetical protein BBJ28_00009394 [Nothophytophthora sp. Chile5]